MTLCLFVNKPSQHQWHNHQIVAWMHVWIASPWSHYEAPIASTIGWNKYNGWTKKTPPSTAFRTLAICGLTNNPTKGHIFRRKEVFFLLCHRRCPIPLWPILALSLGCSNDWLYLEASSGLQHEQMFYIESGGTVLSCCVFTLTCNGSITPSAAIAWTVVISHLLSEHNMGTSLLATQVLVYLDFSTKWMPFWSIQQHPLFVCQMQRHSMPSSKWEWGLNVAVVAFV